jgi:hypothetical protein
MTPNRALTPAADNKTSQSAGIGPAFREFQLKFSNCCSTKGEAVKLKILFVTMLGVAGVASSYAFANGGRDHGRHDTTDPTTTCQRTNVFGTASGPQTLTITVKRATHWKNTTLAPGQVITVSVGATGDTVNVLAGGCVSGSTLSAKGASLLVLPKPKHHGHDFGHGHGHKPKGPSGPTGATGGSGATGASGASGATGASGASGGSGATGASGGSGATGASGGSGSTGP